MRATVSSNEYFWGEVLYHSHGRSILIVNGFQYALSW